MLAGWCPLRWAWIGGLIAVVRIVFSGSAVLGEWASIGYWSQSYWGGTLATLGGAFIFGALPRILRKQRLGASFCLAIGLAILANSRPFEGLVVTVPVIVVLAIWAGSASRVAWGLLIRRIVLPVVMVLSLTTLWMFLYNFRTTGDPLRLPYQVHESSYAAAPVFLWQSLKPAPSYNHKALQEFYVGWARRGYLTQQSFSGWVSTAGWKVVSLWWFFIGPLFTPFLIALPKMLHRRSVRFALATWAFLIVALLMETWTFPHYAAPAAPLALLLIVESLRQGRLVRWRSRPVGRALMRAVLPVLIVSAIVSFALERRLAPSGWHLERARMLQSLKHGQERQLVIVRYGPKHSPHEEWVYNRADIDASKVVWAREMDPRANSELLEYFKDRRVWILAVDRGSSRLEPYPTKPSSK